MKHLTWLFLLTAGLLSAQHSFQKELQTRFILAEAGDTIRIPAGNYQLEGSLWLDDKENMVIQGAGLAQTVLSFANQQSGAEGIKITRSRNITLADLTVLDSKGDAVKVQDTDGIQFIRVKTAWSGKPKSSNGAYGLYPVNCSRVLIDGCEAYGASDAGIYVGQSRHIIVRNSTAWGNVAGIEIENSLYADVYDNKAYNNTGGILVFDLPDLIQKKGGFVRVFRNEVYNNNLANFAPKGNIVGFVPDGTGMIILATNKVEVFDNTFRNNRSIGTAILSYYMTEEPITDTAYYPYPEAIYIHDNQYERRRQRTTFRGRFGKLFRLKLRLGKDVPHIVWDGIVEAGKGVPEICLQNNQAQTFLYLDAEHNFEQMSREVTPYDCKLPALEAVKLD